MTQKRIFNLPIQAGVYTEQTERGAQGQWRYIDKVRFRKGLAEKLGGWVKLQGTFLGTCRRIKDWTSLDGKTWSAIATDVKLYLWQDGTLYDITPLRDSGTLTDPFTTVINTQVVTVAHVNHGCAIGDYVRFSGAGAVGGITIDGEYQVTSTTSDTYTIVDTETATASANGGGTVAYEYDITAGAESVITASGYGTGGYGAEGYGNARTGSTLKLGIRTWSLDTWGEDLLANPRGGSIYWWDKSKGTGSRATALGGEAPISCEYMLVSQRDRHVFALGAYDYYNNAFDPLLIRWGSTEDLNDWVPTSTNTAGDLRLYSGSKIVAGVRSRLETIVFTDVSVHTMPFVGGTTVFGLNIVGENVSLLGPNCAVPIDHRVLFMAESDFYIYDGVVRVVPCDVRNFVYENLNVDQKDKIYGGLNREYNEVWWFYPSYDPGAWVQQDFSLGLPSGYSIANSSTAPPSLYDDVLFQADWEGANGATTYTEESQYLESGTFLNNAQISTTSPIYDTSSLKIDGTNSCRVTFPIDSNLPWDGTGRILTAEVAFRLDGTHSSTKNLILVGDDDVRAFAMGVFISGGVNFYLTGGFSQPYSSVGPLSMTTGVDYVAVIESDYTGGAGNGVERVWFGPKGGTVSLVATRTSQNPPGTSFTSQIIVGEQTTNPSINATVDHMRITNSTTGRYGAASTITVDDPYETTGGGGGPADVGYVYGFDSAGFTERVPTAASAGTYEHDFFLTNDEPIITPYESEYAVELAVSPDIGANTGKAGVCFLRTDLVGTPATHADDCQQWMVSLQYNDGGNGSVIIEKKEGAAPAAPDNQGSNSVDFLTLTGSAMALDTKYIITVQFDTPQITVWVDGFQAFQFDMSTAELALFTTGTAGLHASPVANTAPDQYRFYNFATGPVGTLTAPGFDISPVEVNRYVAFNYEEGTWTTGTLARTAWADRSPLLEKPYATDRLGNIYQHETGTDADGQPMAAFIESYDMEIPEAGEELMHIDQLIPDFLELEGSVDVYLTGRKYPQDMNRISKGPYTVSPGTRKLSTRMRARQVALRVESNNNGDKWRMGVWRGRGGPHGRRG